MALGVGMNPARSYGTHPIAPQLTDTACRQLLTLARAMVPRHGVRPRLMLCDEAALPSSAQLCLPLDGAVYLALTTYWLMLQPNHARILTMPTY